MLQRYAGHATPTMTMRDIAARDEHAFLATAKLRADGTHIALTREDHDSRRIRCRSGYIILCPYAVRQAAEGRVCAS